MASGEDVKAFERAVRNIPLKIITEKLEEGEKTTSELEKALNEVVKEPLNPLVIKLYLNQLEMEGFVEKRNGGEKPVYMLTEKWRRLKAEGKG